MARKSFRNRENIKRKAGNVRRKREVSGKNGKVGISVTCALIQASSVPSHRPRNETELFTLDKQHREFLNGHRGSLHLRNKKHR